MCLNSLILNNEDCHGFLYQGTQLFADLGQANGDQQAMPPFDAHHPFLRPRVPHEIIFVSGGWSAGSATNAVETYDCKTKRWFLALGDNFPRYCTAKKQVLNFENDVLIFNNSSGS